MINIVNVINKCMEKYKPTGLKYRLAKGFISFFIVFSAYFSYSHPQDLAKLGFPDYFRIELVTAKIIGAIVLLLPVTPVRVKEWVYAGFIITMCSALIAHICSSDPLSRILFVTVDLLLILTCIYYVSKKDLATNPINQNQ